jgi:hypothetical protein
MKIIGKFLGFTTKGRTSYLALDIDGKKKSLAVAKGSKEEELLKKAIRSPQEHLTISILVTDDADDRLRVTRIEAPE